MPSQQLGTHEGALFDLVGAYHKLAGAVTHVGMLASAVPVSVGVKVAVLDMGLSKLNIEPPNNIVAHIAGTLPLTREQAEDLKEWVAETQTLAGLCEYIALPAAQFVEDKTSDRRSYWKFSCAGFVLTAYREGAGIQLLAEDDCLPPLDFATVTRIWGPVLRVTDEQRQRTYLSKFGLAGDGPWKVVVPGYLFHALEDERGLPYSPDPGDVSFP